MRIEDILNLKETANSLGKENEKINDEEILLQKEREVVIFNFRKYL